MRRTKLLFLIMFLLLLVSCSEVDPQEIIDLEPTEIDYFLSAESIEVEVNTTELQGIYSDIYVSTSTDETISCTIDDSSVIYDTLGDYTARCSYKVDDETIYIPFTVSIVDTIAPVINSDILEIVSTTLPTITEISELVTITDNYDEDLLLTMDSDAVDILVPGSYVVTLSTEDSSGNIGEFDITVTIYNLDIPTYVIASEDIFETSFVLSYEVTDNVELDDTTFIKAEVQLYDGDTLVETQESTELDDYFQFLNLYSDHEYDTKSIIYYNLNKGDGVESISSNQTTQTKAFTLPTFTIGTTFSRDNNITMYYTYTDSDLVLETMTLNVYDEDDEIYTSVILDGISNHGFVESLAYDSNYTVEVIVAYDLLDGNGISTLVYRGNTVSTAVLVISELMTPDNVIDEVNDYTFQMNLDFPNDYTIEDIYINDLSVSFTVEENSYFVTIPATMIIEGEASYEITKIVVNTGSVSKDVVFEDNNEVIVILQMPLTVSEVIVNNGTSYMSPTSVFQIKLALENHSTYDIQTVVVNNIELTSSSFTIVNDELIVSQTAISTVGGFEISIEALTYLKGTELISLNIDYYDILYSGNINDVHHISTSGGFLSMGNSGIYILEHDIDLTDIYYINYVKDFDGFLDGNGYTISGLDLAAESTSPNYLGLFGVLGSHSLIKNLSMYDMNVSNLSSVADTNPLYVGIIAGYTFGDIYNVSIDSGMISIDDNKIRRIYTGGIVGSSMDSIITLANTNLSYDLKSAYELYVGGLIGKSTDTTILNSYSKGNLDASSLKVYAGGISGYATVSSSTSIYKEVASSLNIEVTVDGASTIFIGGISGVQTSTTTTDVYYKGTLSIIGSAYKLYLGGINGYSATSSIENGYVRATFDLGTNPSTVYCGNVTGILESTTLSNLITEVQYLGTLNTSTNSVTLSDVTSLSTTLSSISNVHLLDLDITFLTGADYELLPNASLIIDPQTFDAQTFYKDILLFDGAIWDLDYSESTELLKLLTVND